MIVEIDRLKLRLK